MAVYGRTWWGKTWLDTFNGIDNSNRLPRGRTYANTGRAHDINIKGNVITAKVRGSQPSPYKVSIELPAFNNQQKENIRKVIESSPTILSAFMNGQLSESLCRKLQEQNIQVFPSKWGDLKARCSCPDYAMPCKHLASVIYLVCTEIDKNPLTVFKIHDCDLHDLIGNFKNDSLESIKSIPDFKHLFKEVTFSKDIKSLDYSTLNDLDLSKIPNLDSQITTILKKDPPFHDKDFRDIMAQMYKYWAKKAASLSASLQYTLDHSDSQKNYNRTLLKYWNHPDTWDFIELSVNKAYTVSKITNQDGEPLSAIKAPYEKNHFNLLVHLLSTLPNDVIEKLSPSLKFAQFLIRFSIKLVERSAIIPEIIQDDKKYLVRWMPALFNDVVRKAFDDACSLCPERFITLEGKAISQIEQVKTFIALVINHISANNVPTPLNRLQTDKIFILFFAKTWTSFDSFAEQSTPQAINQWLSHLSFYDRPHKIFIQVEETKDFDGFNLDVKVRLGENAAITTLADALSELKGADKLTLISDLSLIVEYLPELQNAIDFGSEAFFDLDSFSMVFAQLLPVLRAIGIQIILPKSLEKMLKPTLSLSMSAKEKLTNDRESYLSLETLLNFDWQISIGDKTLTAKEFKELLDKSKGIVRLVDSYVMLDEKEMQSLLKQLENLPEKLSSFEIMQASLSEEYNGASVQLDHKLQSLFKELRKNQPVSIPKNLLAIMRPYQERGFSWLVQNINTGFGGILADDMGLGKTLQVIATILHYKNLGLLQRQRVLIIAPTSLLSNWKKEIEKFAPDLLVQTYHGASRSINGDYDVLLTSYGLARSDKKDLNKISWFLQVIDEAQNIKNPTTAQSKAIKGIDAQNRIAMSGTPVENRMLEYWSIFDFTNKSYLGSQKHFQNYFAKPIEADRNQDRLQAFKKVTEPFILRRLKSDKSIIQDLPGKIESNRFCSLTGKQTALYQETVDLSIEKIEEADGIARKGLVLKLLNALKQICNHPSQFEKKKTFSADESGKMEMLLEILDEIDEVGEKTLIFTQYTEMGDILASLIGEHFDTSVPFLHGGLTIPQRDKIVEQFQNSSQTKVLIVSLKAGGTGLNLTAANHVIHYDLWWNPAVEAQATDRAYRIGQNKNVMVHRFITKGTFEEKIDEMIQSKKELSNLTVSSGENWITEMKTDDLKKLFEIRAA